MAGALQNLKPQSNTLDWEIGRWGQIPYNKFIKGPDFFVFPDLQIFFEVIYAGQYLTVHVNESRLHLNSFPSFHWKACLIDRYGLEWLPKRTNEKIQMLSEHHLFIRWDLQQVNSVLPNEDQLIIRCTFSVESDTTLDGSGSRKHDSSSQTEETSSDDKLSQDLTDLLSDKEDWDVILKVKGRDFQVHKAILRSRSSVFHDMLENDVLEKNNGVVNIDDCDPNCFPEYLLYLYSGKISGISKENVSALSFISNKYNTKELETACLKFMSQYI